MLGTEATRRPPKIREYKPTRIKLTARTRNGEDIQVKVETATGGRPTNAGTLTMSPDEWRALSVLLAFGESKHGTALQTKVEIDADEYVRQVM